MMELLVTSTLLSSITAAQLPNIVHILADDLGWAELGFHRENQTDREVSTPNLDALVTSDALLLERFYVHKICSPTRCAIQSGRAPIHVNVQNVVPEVRNPKDPVGGYQGMPINMTGMASHLRRAGYSTHFVGKWDVGMATELHSPYARGYNTWLGYWHHSNDYWTLDEETCGKNAVKDLWRLNSTMNAPAKDLANSATCTQGNQSNISGPCVFEEVLLTTEVKRVIAEHQGSTSPFFLFWAMHLVHMPLEVPDAYLKKFDFIDDTYRRSMHAMTNYLDTEVGEVIDLLKSTSQWNSTLLVFHADNGGEIKFAGICGGNNWPLRGGKFSNWEGGVRVNALVSGGILPASRRGKTEQGLVTGWDWYATYVKGIAGLDPTDTAAAAAGLPPIDSLNVFDLIMGTNETSPRTEVILGDSSAIEPNADGKTLVGGVIQFDNRTGKLWKIILGSPDVLYIVDQDVRTGPSWPNSSSSLIPSLHTRTCGRAASRGCLFEVNSDPYELHNLAGTYPSMFEMMLAKVDAHQTTVYSPVRGKVDPNACKVAEGLGGWWGPWYKFNST